MHDPKDRVVDIARRLSQRMDSFSPQGQMGDLHKALKEALAEIDSDHPFRCHLCDVSFMTMPELEGHRHSAEHIHRLNHPSQFSICSG